MGNTVVGAVSGGGGGGRRCKKAKVMKVNGEFFKLNTPAKAGDITTDYPGHVLLDSDDFLRYNLRSQPLGPDSDLRSGHIYLLVQLPKFPARDPPEDVSLSLQRSNSVNGEYSSSKCNPDMPRLNRRSVSHLSVASRGSDGEPAAMRVKVRLPKAEVDRIVEESKDDTEVAKKIIFGLHMNGDGGEAAPTATRKLEATMEEEELVEGVVTSGDETTGKVSFSKCCASLRPIPRLGGPYATSTAGHRSSSKYKKLINNE